LAARPTAESQTALSVVPAGAAGGRRGEHSVLRQRPGTEKHAGGAGFHAADSPGETAARLVHGLLSARGLRVATVAACPPPRRVHPGSRTRRKRRGARAAGHALAVPAPAPPSLSHLRTPNAHAA